MHQSIDVYITGLLKCHVPGKAANLSAIDDLLITTLGIYVLDKRVAGGTAG
jgi:hypothetical protein